MDNWEYLFCDRDSTVYRLKIPGGWIYKNIEVREMAIAMVFVPDNNCI